MYAFLSHSSACDALRTLGSSVRNLPAWPAEPRELPIHRNTVTTQRMFQDYAKTVDLASYGAARQPVDLLVCSAKHRSRGKLAQFHAWKHAVPAGAMLRLEETLFVSTPEFVLLQMAGYHTRQNTTNKVFSRELNEAREVYARAGIEGEVPYDDPFAWEKYRQIVRMALVASEFMGTYRLAGFGGETQYGLAPVMTSEHVEQLMAGVTRVYGRGRIRRAMELAFANSASPMETALALMLCSPEEYGGYGLPRPELNRSVPVSGHQLLWSGGPSITPDLLWETWKVVIEYDSDENHGSLGPRKLASDATRANVLTSLGYRVLRVTTLNIQQLDEMDRLARQVAAAIGAPFVEPDEVLRIRRRKLHELLMGQ